MKDKYIAIIQNQIIMKIIIWSQEFYKTLTWIWKDSRGMVLASSSASQTRRFALDSIACHIICEIHKFQHLWHDHEHLCIIEVTLLIFSFES